MTTDMTSVKPYNDLKDTTIWVFCTNSKSYFTRNTF